MTMKKLTRRTPSPSELPSAVPRHIAMIMDGNGRWAQARGLPRKLGHQRGAETLKSVLEGCRELGIQYLTIYAFSSENWNRSEPEVNDLMELMRFYLRKEVKSLHENKIRLQFIGDQSRLSPAIQKELKSAETLTQRNNALHLTVALSYGSRQELMKAIRTMAVEIASGKMTPEEIDEYTVLAHLDTANLPDPDLLIRTGGDMRLSNFLLWQSAYTELYFTPTLWPDFTKDNLAAAVNEYGTRERRFGARA
jgi:undecaprenyl diphosphate synthase